MNKSRIWIFALVLVLALAGCRNAAPAASSAEPPSSVDAAARTVPPTPVSLEPDSSVDSAPVPEPDPIDYDVAGLYLQVLEDLWPMGFLNDGITYISVDLSSAPGGLTDAEKAGIAETFAAEHQKLPLTLSYQELIDQGYFTEERGSWEDGLLFRIRACEGTDIDQSPADMKFDAEIWRASEGAYFYWECTPIWSETGACEGFTIGSEAIS